MFSGFLFSKPDPASPRTAASLQGARLQQARSQRRAGALPARTRLPRRESGVRLRERSATVSGARCG